MVHASRKSFQIYTRGTPLSILIVTLTLLILGSFLQRAFGHFNNQDALARMLSIKSSPSH